MSVTTNFLTAKNEGNRLFRLASEQEEALSSLKFRDKMQEAISCYNQALKATRTWQEASSVEKNLAVAHSKIGEKFLQNGQGHSTESLYYFKHAMIHFEAAWVKGRQAGSQTSEWIVDLENRMDSCAHSIWSSARQPDGRVDKEQRGQVHGMADAMPHGGIARARLFNRGMAEYFHEAVCLQEAGGVENLKLAKALLLEAEQCVAEAKACVPISEDAMDYVEERKIDIFIHLCISESAAAKEMGMKFMKSALEDSEDLDMDKLFIAMDFFREAIVLSREKDIPLEAEAYAHLGLLWDKMICERSKAREYYKYSIELAQTVVSEILSNAEWLKKAKVRLEEFQSTDRAKEQAAFRKKCEPVMDKLKPILEALKKEKERGAIHLLAHVYEKHPPRRKAKVVEKGSEGENDLRKRLRRALVDYHPDRQEFKDDLEWVVVSEEITKHLNHFYSNMKCS